MPSVLSGAARAIALGVIGAVIACGGSGSKVSSAAPPLDICGSTLNSSAEGAVIYDISEGQQVVVSELSAGNLLYFKVSASCQSGSEVALSPPDSYSVVGSARAVDMRYAAVVLKPTRLVMTELTASRDGQVVGTADIKVT